MPRFCKIITSTFLILIKILQLSTVASVLLSLIPFVTLLILNILIYQTLRHRSTSLSRSSRRKQRDYFVASILIVIIMVYALCHSIKAFINIIELFCVLTGEVYLLTIGLIV